MNQTTRWSLIQAATRGHPDSRPALEQLCRAYQPAVMAYLRRTGVARDAVEDLAQSFFLHLLESDLPAKADPTRGRFRVFLRAALNNHLSHLREHELAQRRHAPGGLLGMDAIEQQGDDTGPEQAFDQAWALTVLNRGLARLQADCIERGQEEEFVALRPALTEGLDPGDLDALAQRLGLRANTLSVRLHRLRERLRVVIRRELAETVSEQADVDTELRHLRGLLGRREAS